MNFKISIIVPFFYKERIVGENTPDFDLLSFNKCLSDIFKSKYKNYFLRSYSLIKKLFDKYT